MLKARTTFAVALVVAGATGGWAVWRQAEATSEAAAAVAVPGARSVQLSYSLTVHDLPAGAERVEAWVPLPREHAFQTLEGFSLVDDYPAVVVEDETFGNRFLKLDLSAATDPAPESPVTATLEAAVTRRGYSVWNGSTAAGIGPQPLERYLQPNRLVPIDGFIADEAWRVVGDADRPLEKARRLYDHVVETLDYDKSGEGWGRGDASYACDVRTGNCTDFHSLFIAEARAVGVPARFAIGFPLPADDSEGTVPGYHCWSEFWLEGRGWVPVDASEAHKHPEKHEFFFGGLDADRVEFTIGRDLDLPGAAVEDLNFVVYPHVEVDGQVHEAVETEFTFRSAPAAESS